MRIALVLLVVVAVVLATALVPRTATAHGRLFSTSQALHAFATEGLPLHPAARDRQASGRKAFSGPHGAGLSVIVVDPGAPRAFALGWTGKPPTTSGEGNVVAIWTPSSGAETTRIRAALGRLATLDPR